MNEQIMVSIVCIAYNHGKYIAEAIEGFLTQKTDFPLEILIHDDASTDNTAEIIMEYYKKYPNIIRPIIQEENQHSQGVEMLSDIIFPKLRGKYIALCEGDDYWIDSDKLQKQVNYMETNPDCSVCFHGAYSVDSESRTIVAEIRSSDGNSIISPEDVIFAGGAAFATNSLLFPKRLLENVTYFNMGIEVRDYPLAIYLALQGKVYYMDEIMSVYRVGVKGSWTNRKFSEIDKKIEHYREIADMLDEVNRYSNYKYDSVIQERKRNNKWYLLLEQGKLKEAKSGEYKDIYMNLSFKNRVWIHLERYTPRIIYGWTSYKRKRRWKTENSNI